MILIFMFCINLAASITASVDSKQAQLGDTVTLTITFSQASQMAQPDLSRLHRNFEILNTASSTRVSIVNGVTRMKMTLVYTLVPRKIGNLKIPALRFGNQHTKPITIHVTQHSAQRAFRNNDVVIIQSSVDTKHPYVQQQITYTLKIFYRKVITNYVVTNPALDNAVVLKIGDDRRYLATRNGERYQVLERDYVLFPQHSGKYQITSPTLTGYVGSELRSRQFAGFMMNTGQPIRSVGNTVHINVKPIPASFAGNNWLPAKKVRLKQNWSDQLRHAKVGNAITRTVTLEVVGLSESQLPNLTIASPDNISTYPDPVKSENVFEDGNIVAVKQFKIAYIPNKDGKMVIPKITVPWWNVKKRRNEVAKLDAIHLTVKPGKIARTAKTL